MTGPEHYRQAERLIASATLDGTHPDGSPLVRSNEPEVIALAQVHATLALAAAQALRYVAGGRYNPAADAECDVWEELVTHPQPSTKDGT